MRKDDQKTDSDGQAEAETPKPKVVLEGSH